MAGFRLVSSADYTAWFPPSVEPGQSGVFEVKRDKATRHAGRLFRKWDGFDWFYGAVTPEEAAKIEARLPNSLLAEWRGLKNERKV